VEKTAPFSEHVEELKRRALACLAAFSVLSVLSWFVADKALAVASRPVGQLVFFSPAEAFLVKFKISMLIGAVLASPALLYNFWRYVSPALLDSERVYGWLLPASYGLLLLGMVFGFLVVWPVGIKFLLSFQSENLKAMMSIGEYLGFLFYFLIAFGVVFQTPLIILFLSLTGIVSPEFLASKRKIAILVIFILAAILTPGPDVFSQLMVAFPMILFFEVGILISRVAGRRGRTGNA
jgi:sec-independent protein translocase protein TatC